MEATAVQTWRRIRITREQLSLPLALLSYFLLDFSLRWLYGVAGSSSLWAWQPMVFTALWSLVLTCVAARGF